MTGDLWNYGVLDDVKNLAMNYSDLKSLVTGIAAGDSTSGTTTTTGTTTGAATGRTDGSGSTSDTTTTVTGATAVDRLSNLLVPTTSEILWGIVSGDILSTAWQKLTSNTGSLMSIGFQQIAEITGTPFKQIFNYIGGGATYICYVNGAVASYTTAIKYPVLAGGIAVRQETTGSVKAMMQLMPLKRSTRSARPRCSRAMNAMRWQTMCRSTCGTRASITPPSWLRWMRTATS